MNSKTNNPIFTSNIGGMLPDYMIRELVKIDPFVETSPPGVISYGLTSYGYDTRVGRNYKVFHNVTNGMMDPKNFTKDGFVDFNDVDYCIIPANSFALAESVETFEIPRDVMAIVVGKSTYARSAIIVNITPLESEWRGKITIEISNTAPIPAKVYSGEGIAQVLFVQGVMPCRRSYADKKGKYQDQGGITLPIVK